MRLLELNPVSYMRVLDGTALPVVDWRSIWGLSGDIK